MPVRHSYLAWFQETVAEVGPVAGLAGRAAGVGADGQVARGVPVGERRVVAADPRGVAVGAMLAQFPDQ